MSKNTKKAAAVAPPVVETPVAAPVVAAVVETPVEKSAFEKYAEEITAKAALVVQLAPFQKAVTELKAKLVLAEKELANKQAEIGFKMPEPEPEPSTKSAKGGSKGKKVIKKLAELTKKQKARREAILKAIADIGKPASNTDIAAQIGEDKATVFVHFNTTDIKSYLDETTGADGRTLLYTVKK